MIRSPLNPTERQTEIALQGSNIASEEIHWITLKEFCSRVEKQRPDAVVFGATGGFIRLCISRLLQTMKTNMPLLATGISGINVLPENLNINLRAGCHVYVAASRKEVLDIRNKQFELGIPFEVALTTIPYLQHNRRLTSAPQSLIEIVVFTPQPSVPKSYEERKQLLKQLAALKNTFPHLEIFVKLRAIGREKQTHAELWPFSKLWEELVLDGEVQPNAVLFTDGAMQDFLIDENTLVLTVSSTSAIEALDAGCRVGIISDFGVSRENLNDAFIGSGLITQISQITPSFAGIADDDWARDNYFHAETENNLSSAFTTLLQQRSAGNLPMFSNLPALATEMLFWESVRANLPRWLSRFLIGAMRPIGRFVKRIGNALIRRTMIALGMHQPAEQLEQGTLDRVHSSEP